MRNALVALNDTLKLVLQGADLCPSHVLVSSLGHLVVLALELFDTVLDGVCQARSLLRDAGELCMRLLRSRLVDVVEGAVVQVCNTADVVLDLADHVLDGRDLAKEGLVGARGLGGRDQQSSRENRGGAALLTFMSPAPPAGFSCIS